MGSTMECSVWQVPMSLSAAMRGLQSCMARARFHTFYGRVLPSKRRYAIVQMEDLRALNGLPPFGGNEK